MSTVADASSLSAVADRVLRAEPELVPAVGGRRSTVLHRLLAAADAIGSATAGLLAGLLTGLPLADASVVALTAALILPPLAFVCGLYAADDLRSWSTGVPESKRLVFAAVVLSWPIYATAVHLQAPNPWLVTLVGTVLTLLLTASGRAAARSAAHRSRRLRERTVIVGSGLVAGELVHNLRHHRELGLVPVGIVEDAEHHRSVADVPHLGTLNELSTVLREYRVDRVIIAFTRGGHVQLLQAIRACRDHRVPVHVVPRLFEFLDGARALDHVGGLPLLSLGVPRLTVASRAAKRGVDIVVSSLALVVGAPLFAIIALAIKVESPGPVFFRQLRGGRGATAFWLLKFRSMYDGADQRKAELLGDNEARCGVMFKIRRDPRTTRVGRILRRFSLDELPQMWNVLRGEMSLVGPRPLVPAETEWLAEEWHARRRDLRPGLTGPWQIYGRSEIPFQDMVRFDYQYVAGWSLSRDVEILLATVPAVLAGRGAY